ncbi:MAG: hypothetical protein M3081_19115 [Gemmatimonadota bacterium]|nr:hypothetical protein [Gemmatimonadota bacterium]
MENAYPTTFSAKLAVRRADAKPKKSTSPPGTTMYDSTITSTNCAAIQT